MMHFKASTAVRGTLQAALLVSIAWAAYVEAEPSTLSQDQAEPAADPTEATFNLGSGLDLGLGPGPDFSGSWGEFRVVEDAGARPESAEPLEDEAERSATDPILADATSELAEVEDELAARRAELERHEADLERRRSQLSRQRAQLSSRRAELTAIDEELSNKRGELARVEAAIAQAEAPEPKQSSEAELTEIDIPVLVNPPSPPREAAGEPSTSLDTREVQPPPGTWMPPIHSVMEGLGDLIPVTPSRQLARVLAVLMVALLIAVRRWRRRGDLAVYIDYPDELRGTFRVRIATSKGRLGRNPYTARREILRGGTSTASEHHLVRRETSFRGVACRRYFLSVDGLLQDPNTGEVLLDCYERTSVRVQPRRTERAEFSFSPQTCPIDVLVSWDSKPARDAAIVVRGNSSVSSRREGPVRLKLPKGKHTLVVGCEDRILEHEIDVQSFQPTRVEINVAGVGEVIFKGCPPAVHPYLVGDIEAAAEALERDGQSEQAHLLLARFELERGSTAAAADHFEAAKRWVEAAEHHASLSNFLRAAELFNKAGDLVSSAEMYQLAGQWLRAGEAYEMARDWNNAAVCFQEAGAVGRWIDALERQGRGFEAAKIALDNGESSRGIGLLQRVTPDDPHYPEACSLLADAFEHEGHYDLAIQKIEDQLAASSSGRRSGRLHARLADLLEQAGSFERALDVLEELRRLQPMYPNVATRIEVLRKQSSSRQPTPVSARLSGGKPTMFLDQRRYEIIEEIGRGGMGVVFKAHDRRLGRMVALKRLPENLRRDHPKAVELFLREARSTASLNHPNIVTVYDTDQEDDCFFITMELLKGQPLHLILQERGHLPATEVASLGVQVTTGLHYAHQVGVIHRDIKTSNLFLTEDGVVKIMDFGLAKMLEQVRSVSSVVGTPFYMAPEQAQARPVDHRADLYSLGVTLFELLTGKVPFPDAKGGRREVALDDLRDKLAEAPDLLVDLVLKLLAEDPNDRCASAAELLVLLDQVLSTSRPTPRL